jgi:glucose/arabinose dehydrogenase
LPRFARNDPSPFFRPLARTSIKNFAAFVAALALLFILPAMGHAQVSPSPSPNIQLTAVITGISNPVAITNAGDGSGRLFVTLQGGRILVYDGVQLLQEPFLDISSLITSGGERGLLSVAFHPNYLQNGFLYVNYTDLNGDTVVARYTVSADTNRVDAASALILLQVLQPFTNHNGGQLKFGPDGYLYIGMGDGGSGGDPLNHAQTLNSLLGKMLRIDVDAGSPYAIPPDNPFVGVADARPEIWALGLRNPWRFTFDRLTGDLWIADVGQNLFEEVNFQPGNSLGGENYGWRLMEGESCFIPVADCNDGTLTLPVIQYDHSLGCSVTGGYRYRGVVNPGMAGVYFYADFCTGRIWGATEGVGQTWTATELLDTDLSITTFGEDEEGEIYVAHFSSTAGAVYRISEIQAQDEPQLVASGGSGGCFFSAVLN